MEEISPSGVYVSGDTQENQREERCVDTLRRLATVLMAQPRLGSHGTASATQQEHDGGTFIFPPSAPAAPTLWP